MSKFSFSNFKNNDDDINMNMEYDPYNKNNTFITKSIIKQMLLSIDVEYEPEDMDLIQRAFVHKSYCKNMVDSQLEKYKNMKLVEKPDDAMDIQPLSYERLEFLGDSIVGAVVVAYLYERFFDQNEGKMTMLKSKLVNTSALCKFAKILGFQKYIIFSKQYEEKPNSRETDNILEDIFEAFIGAIFMDANNKNIPENGFEICNEIILNIIENEVDVENLIIDNQNYKDKILKYFQYNFGTTPSYREETNLTEIIDGKKKYTMSVIDQSGKVLASFSDFNKKHAEQMASKIALQDLKKMNM